MTLSASRSCRSRCSSPVPSPSLSKMGDQQIARHFEFDIDSPFQRLVSRRHGHARVDRVSLVVVKYELSRTPIGIAGRLDQLDARGTKPLAEGVNVVNAQIQMQMPAFIHEFNGRILRIYTLQVKTPAARSDARI